MSSQSKDHINEAMNASVADPIPLPSPVQVGALLAVDNMTFYISADGFSGDPDGLLGSVIQLREVPGNGESSTRLELEFNADMIIGTTVKPTSHLKEPTKRKSIIVDQSLVTSVSFLNYLKGEVNAQSTFSLLVFDQATGQVDRNQKSWPEGIEDWRKNNAETLDNPDIKKVFVIIAYVQKYVIRKTFRKFEGKLTGSFYGVNVKGELYTSTEDYTLDIRYGLTVAPLKSTPAKVTGFAPVKTINYELSEKDVTVLQQFTRIADAKTT